MKYGELSLGQIEAVVNKLGGMEGVERLLAGETVIRVTTLPEFHVWETIKLGTGLMTPDDFRCALKDAGFLLSDGGSDILGNPAFTVSLEETEVDLVVVSVSELGFNDGAARADIYKRAKELGLEICPAEVGPQFRLQSDQLSGEWLSIGMKPIVGSDGQLSVFRVVHDGSGQWLIDISGDPGYSWSGNDRFVFVSTK